MSIRKRNEFLDASDSEEDGDAGYDSDAVEEGKGARTGRDNKRRKTQALADAEESPGDVTDGEEERAPPTKAREETVSDPRFTFAPGDFDEDEEHEPVVLSNLKASTPKQVEKAQKAARKSGVVYISRVPPFMKPQTLRHFLSPHAPKGLGRIFLTPEDPAAHSRRVKSGGNKKKSFTDGWVEFTSKREAQDAAEALNGNIIGGRKGNFYHDDLWNMKYLKGFKWSHLTEQIASENAERAARMREEVRKTRKENKAFVEDVERGKMLEGVEATRKARESNGKEKTHAQHTGRRENKFEQKKAQASRKTDDKLSEQSSRVSKMIF